MIIGLTIAGAIVVVGAGFTIGVYNTLVTGKNDYAGQWANIKTEYQRRYDLFMNLVETVKGHVKFEKETLVELTKARSGIESNKPLGKTQMNKLDNLFSGLKIQVEAYPELKSNVHYTKLMEEISETEERIVFARTEVNHIAEDFNTYIETFPTNLVAKGIFNAKKLQYYQNEGSKVDKSPRIKFET